MLPSNAMDTTFKSLEVMDRLHNIQSPDYIQQPELLCLAGAWGSGTFAGVRSLPHLATTQILSLFTSIELYSLTEAFLALLVSFPFMMLFDIVPLVSGSC